MVFVFCIYYFCILGLKRFLSIRWRRQLLYRSQTTQRRRVNASNFVEIGNEKHTTKGTKIYPISILRTFN